MDPISNEQGQAAPETAPEVAQPEMEQTPEVNAPDSPVSPAASSETGIGAIVGSVIVIVVLILGGFYFWSQRSSNLDMLLEEPVPTEDAALTELQTQSTSDNISSIEADLNSTDLNDLDAELGDIDALLNAEI